MGLDVGDNLDTEGMYGEYSVHTCTVCKESPAVWVGICMVVTVHGECSALHA